jgi:predicted phage terminase large subunit-like protein
VADGLDPSTLGLRMNWYMRMRPTPKQAAFLLMSTLEVFYGGAAGGAKSTALLLGALQYVDVSGYAALLVRKTYQQLTQPGALIAASKQLLEGTDAVWNAGEHTWYFPSGATLRFASMSDSSSHLDLQGTEFQYIGIDEVTDLDEDQYRFLFSRLRRRSDLEVPMRVRAASNPVGRGRDWVYRRFVLGRGPERIYLAARLEDNPYLDQVAYETSLAELGPIAYRQLRFGDWEIRPEGGLLKAEWFTENVVDPPELPEHLRLCRYWDLAATEASAGRDPDHTAGVLLGRGRSGDYYICDIVRFRGSPLTVERKIAAVAKRDRAWASERGYRPVAIRMEEEPGSAGKSVIDHYRREVLDGYAFKGVRATGSKQMRAEPVAARVEAGDVRMCAGRWNDAFLDEAVLFPLGDHDDQIDALTGAFAFLSAKGSDAVPIPRGFTEPSYWKIP